ncbi:sugar kinase [Brevibacillus fluminis]|uniref:Sugar kinase n=1 Tax=Brevibacillus fluminis TaxID=511487 RepID=A0A3M8DG17_9BACL|nr:sugar kinase [Brevibacillus fluminis]RNB86948.1 sugar kinase [Brevibacillus fluminis]
MITVVGDLLVEILVRKGQTRYATDTEGTVDMRPGGQALNVASWCAREGADTRLIGKIGRDVFGDYLLEKATKAGIGCELVRDEQEETGRNVILIDRETGERSMIPDRRVNMRLSPEDVDVAGIGRSRLLYLSGYSLFDEQLRRTALHAKAAALAHNVPIALDPSSTFHLRELKELFLQQLPGVTFLFPNYEEGALLTGQEEPEAILRELHRHVPIPILKLGKDGCILLDGDTVVRLPAPKVNVVDTTGAGDSFAGSFLAAYSKTGDPIVAATRAIEVSSHAVTQVGGSGCS